MSTRPCRVAAVAERPSLALRGLQHHPAFYADNAIDSKGALGTKMSSRQLHTAYTPFKSTSK